MRNVYISYTHLVYAIKRGEISFIDLQSGLFHFGCLRENIIDSEGNPSGQMLEYIEKSRKPSKLPALETLTHKQSYSTLHIVEVFEIIRDAILKAEEEARILWREMEEIESSWAKLNTLLERNGYSRLKVADIPNWEDSGFMFQNPNEEPFPDTWCYPNASVAIEGSKQDLKCVW